MPVTNGMNGHKAGIGLQWRVGLVNSSNRYLTAESFGHKVNASGTTLKKKQLWTLEQDADDDSVYLKSHLGCYISTDRYGKVTCETDEKTNTEKFEVLYSPDGRWAFKNKQFETFLGGSEDNLICSAKNLDTGVYWTLQLDIHPQVTLRNVNRRRFAILREDEIQCTEVIPWGIECLIVMVFIGGKYALRTSDNRYISRTGTLENEAGENSLFTLEIKSGQNSGFALRDTQGKYLTAVGSTATVQSRNSSISKDELFTLEVCHPQGYFISLLNNKKASTKQGVDVSANQDDEEITEREIFQVEYEPNSSKWAIRTSDNKYWSLEKAGIQANASEISSKTLFDMEWQGDGSLALKAANSNYVFAKPTGSLCAGGDKISDKEKFRFTLTNRPTIILKGEYGFVGFKSQNSAKPEYVCNKASQDNAFMEAAENGTYHLKGCNGKYWRLSDEGTVFSDSDKPTPFIVEFRGQSLVTIKAPNDCYLKGEQNGIFQAKSQEITSSCLWEC